MILICKHASREIRFIQFFNVPAVLETAILPLLNCLKYRNRPKLCGNCAIPQNFYTRKLGKFTVFYAVINFHCLTKTEDKTWYRTAKKNS